MNGRTLNKISDIHLTKDEKITILFELMITLEFLHRNHFIYRDLKPNNVIIDKNKTIVLIDFDRMINADDIVDINNHSCALNNLGVIYFEGESVKEDKQKAFHYFSRAANENNANSLYSLGAIYTNGTIVHKDMNKAVYYFSRSAISFDWSQNVLGILYYEGKEIKKISINV